MTTLTETEVFVLADRALEGVVAQITDDQWAMEMPESFMTRMLDHRPTLREIINYHAYDDAWIPDILAGRTIDDVGKEAFTGDLLGDAPQQSFSAIVDKAVAAAQGLDDLSRTAHLSYGDYTMQEYLWQANYFRSVRVHDIAKVISVDPTLPGPLVEGLWAELVPVAEEWRAIGVVGPRVEVPVTAPLQDQLLGLLGRDPAA
jgi:hypothetical protein